MTSADRVGPQMAYFSVQGHGAVCRFVRIQIPAGFGTMRRLVARHVAWMGAFSTCVRADEQRPFCDEAWCATRCLDGASRLACGQRSKTVLCCGGLVHDTLPGMGRLDLHVDRRAKNTLCGGSCFELVERSAQGFLSECVVPKTKRPMVCMLVDDSQVSIQSL